jgi:aminopeptidase N
MNLTRDEARQRAAIVSVHSYAINLDLTRGDSVFGSTTVVSFDAEQGSSTFIDAVTASAHRVTLNGVDLDVEDVADGVRIRLDNLAASNELVVDADMLYMNTGEGLHRFVDPVDNEIYLYTQFEVPDSRRVFAVFEQPDLKATLRTGMSSPTPPLLSPSAPAQPTTAPPAPHGRSNRRRCSPPTSPRSSPVRTSPCAAS